MENYRRPRGGRTRHLAIRRPQLVCLPPRACTPFDHHFATPSATALGDLTRASGREGKRVAQLPVLRTFRRRGLERRELLLHSAELGGARGRRFHLRARRWFCEPQATQPRKAPDSVSLRDINKYLMAFKYGFEGS